MTFHATNPLDLLQFFFLCTSVIVIAPFCFAIVFSSPFCASKRLYFLIVALSWLLHLYLEFFHFDAFIYYCKRYGVILSDLMKFLSK